MSNEIQQTNNYFLPTSFDQAERFAEKIASSAICPTAFKGKPGDVFVAMQMGAEVGLSPMAAIQNIAVINGRPSLYGDALLGVIRAHKHCQGVREWMDGSIENNNAIAYCAITRKGQQEEVRSFSMVQAKKAGLLNKAGVWSQYPERMLQMRARGFCARDVFADALRGLHCAEEVQDYIDVQAEAVNIPNMKIIEGQPLSQSFIVDANTLETWLEGIESANDWDSLKLIYNNAKKDVKGDKDASNRISKATKDRQDFLRKEKEQVEVKQIEQKTESQKEPESDHSEFLAAYEGK